MIPESYYECMSGTLECDSCGHRHKMGERVFDEDTKRTTCPECGRYSFMVDRGDISWHPALDE